MALFSGHIRPRQGQKSAISGAVSTGFFLFPSFYVQFGWKRPPKSGESSEKSSGENSVKSCHVCGRHGFSAPIFRSLEPQMMEKPSKTQFALVMPALKKRNQNPGLERGNVRKCDSNEFTRVRGGSTCVTTVPFVLLAFLFPVSEYLFIETGHVPLKM